jgi:hypothetical protein
MLYFIFFYYILFCTCVLILPGKMQNVETKTSINLRSPREYIQNKESFLIGLTNDIEKHLEFRNSTCF